MFKDLLYHIRFWRFHTIHFLSRKKIEAWQSRRLVKLMQYVRNVPMYRELLAQAGIAADSIRGIEDLHLLPIITKQTFLGRYQEEYLNPNLAAYGTWTNTSGTSGTPFSAIRRAISEAPLYRDSFRYRFLLDKQRTRFDVDWARVVYIRVFPVERENHFVVPITDLLNDPDRAVQQVVDHKPDIFENYPAVIYEFIRALKERKIDLTIPYVITTGEKLSSSLRATIEETLHAEVFDRYGLEEIGSIATECEMHDGCHIHAESIIIEIVDDEGNPVPEGESGRVIITDLYNFNMPFVRYDAGDRARISWERCGCGLEAPRIWLEGRQTIATSLTLRGRKFHHFELTESLKMFMNSILQFQFERTADDGLLIRIIPGPAYDETIERQVRAKVAAVVGSDVPITIETHATIGKLPGGKIPPVVQLLK